MKTLYWRSIKAVLFFGIAIVAFSCAPLGKKRGEEKTIPPVTISGTVTDYVTNRPVPSASVYARQNNVVLANGTTDTLGRFTFEVVASEGLLIELVARAADSRTDGTLRIFAHEGQDVRIEIEKKILVSGKVRDMAGTPLAGVRVENIGYVGQDKSGRDVIYLGAPASSSPAITDERGYYELLVPCRGDAVRIRAGRQEYVQGDTTLDVDRDMRVDFRLTRGFIIEGKVVGKAAGSVPLEIRDPSWPEGQWMFLHAASDGAFTYTVAENKEYLLQVVSGAGYQSRGPIRVRPGQPVSLSVERAP